MEEEKVTMWDSINQFIESPVSQSILLPLFQHLVIPLLILWVAYIGVQKGIEKYKHNNSKELQFENFYREVSAKDMDYLLSEWSKMILIKGAVGSISGLEYERLMQMTVMYSGERTIKIAKLYSQHSYAADDVEKENKERYNYKTLVYFAMLVSSLKKDFTNINLKPMDILEIKLTNFKEEEATFKELENEIDKEVKKQ